MALLPPVSRDEIESQKGEERAGVWVCGVGPREDFCYYTHGP